MDPNLRLKNESLIPSLHADEIEFKQNSETKLSELYKYALDKSFIDSTATQRDDLFYEQLTDPSTLKPHSNTETKSDDVEMETLNTTGITKVNADYKSFHTRTGTATRGGTATTPTMYEQSVIDAQRKVKGLELINRSFNNDEFDFVTEPLHETRSVRTIQSRW